MSTDSFNSPVKLWINLKKIATQGFSAYFGWTLLNDNKIAMYK